MLVKPLQSRWMQYSLILWGNIVYTGNPDLLPKVVNSPCVLCAHRHTIKLTLSLAFCCFNSLSLPLSLSLFSPLSLSLSLSLTHSLSCSLALSLSPHNGKECGRGGGGIFAVPCETMSRLPEVNKQIYKQT